MEPRHVRFLEESNERDYAAGRSSYETHVRYETISAQCHRCPLCGNGQQGDMLDECRVAFLRLFVSMKRDDEARFKAAVKPP